MAGGNNSAADESNTILQEQLEREEKADAYKLSNVQEEEFDIVKAKTGGNFDAKAPTQADYPQWRL